MKRGLFQRHAQSLQTVYRMCDLLLIVVACWIANIIRFKTVTLDQHIVIAILIAVLTAMVVFRVTNVYRPKRGKTVLDDIFNLTWSFALWFLILTLLAYATKTGSVISREWAIYSLSISYLFLAISRVLINKALIHFRESGFNTKNAIVFGSGKLGIEVANRLESEKWAGIKVVGFCEETPGMHDKKQHQKPVLRGLNELVKVLEAPQYFNYSFKTIDQVWITLPMDRSEDIRKIVKSLQNHMVEIQYVPDVGGMELLSYPVDQFAGIPILNMSSNRIIGPELIVKRLFDILFSSLVLLLIWPLLILIAIAIKMESKGPVLFKQQRYGIDGTKIEIWKFRSMVVLESGDTAKQATKNDPRVTRLGRLLRKSSLDELPQFFNVLQGSMSVVGPRPHPMNLDDTYRQKIDQYVARHIVKPGITGWAQVNGWRGETDTTEKMKQRINHDLEYIQNWSLTFDLRIILLTIAKGFTNESAY